MTYLNENMNAQIFLTDYASYNNGTQFEFGHWVDLNDHSDADALNEYIVNHFLEADEKSPLGYPREEIMITDCEGFPEQFYSESSMDFEKLYEYLELNDEDRAKVVYHLQDGQDIPYAMDNYEDIDLQLWGGSFGEKVELFEMYYPDAEDSSNKNGYVSIDYDRFISDNFTEITINEIDYLITNKN